MARIILVSGKGGVGKTTVAAATALAAARRGVRTLVMSLDIAHSLADSFDVGVDLFNQNKGMPRRVAENLDLQEVDVQEEIERHWSEVYRYVASLFMATGLEGVVAEEVAIVPGLDDVIALMYLKQHLDQGKYDLIVLDAPPTGESLRFVNIYATIQWYVSKRFKVDRNLAKVVRPLMNRVSDVPIPDDNYFAALMRLYSRLDGIDEVLVNPAITTVRLVTNAEKMVVRETQRAFMYFSLYGMTTDLVVINRLMPEGAATYFEKWAKTQAVYAEEISQYFEPVPVSKLPMFPEEVVGLDRIGNVSDALYGDEDPARFYLTSPPYSFVKQGGEYTLRMNLPFVSKDDVDISRVNDDVIVRVGSFKRHVPVPRSMHRLATAGASLEGSQLVIRFVEQGGAA